MKMAFDIVLLPILAGIVSVLFAAFLTVNVLRKPMGSQKMQEISKAIQEGASAYLNRQYRTISIIAIIVGVILYVTINWQTAVGFFVGAFLSAIAGYIGMNISVRANVRTAE